jgi:rhodanese-related sulfurtransferase
MTVKAAIRSLPNTLTPRNTVKTSHLIRLALVSAFLLIVAACGGSQSAAVDLGVETQVVPVDGGTYTDVTVRGLVDKLQTKDFVLVNVHIPYAGEIDNTDLFIPFDRIAQNLSQLPSNKDAQIVVYCRSGGMSAISATELVRQGYTNVWNLDGGMNAWTAAGEPLLQKDA